ncbi:unnamed protein product [Pedinophyceae sp. YPF-701]|nr:unnamed protein product [Pedinophyceae sp. YPF-701]
MEAFERERDCNYSMQLQIIEIYNEQITDLMSADARGRRQLVIRDGSDGAGPEVAGAVKRAVQSASQTCAVITECMSRRTIGRTDMNCLSSRSHLVITFFVRCEPGTADATSASVTRLHICDLAGSERQPKTGAQGQRLREGCQINQSLSTLSSCISALADKSRHVPYRDSKLTRLLSDSLGGSALLLLLLTVSPAPEHANETLQTLRFGARAIGGLQGTVAPVRREREPDSAQLAALQERCWVAEASLARLQAAVTPVHQRGKHADWATGTALASSCVALLLYVVVEVVWAHVGWRLTDGHGAEEQAARSAAGGFGAV